MLTSGTPGLSENRGGVSLFYDFDQIGNLWTLDGPGKSQLAYEDFSGFGGVTAGGAGTTPFKFGGGNGCQTDADTGLVLMGHRYYDTRIGRFISQDPAGDGDNWYAYADNSPTNEVDPTGLAPMGDYPPVDGEPPIPGSETDDGNGNSGASYLLPSSFTQPGTSSGGFVNDGTVGMFNRPETPGELSFDRGVTAILDAGSNGQFSQFTQKGTAGAYGLFALGVAANAFGPEGGGGGANASSGALKGWIAKDVFSTLKQDVGQGNFEKFVEALQKGVVGPEGKAGIKALKGNIGYTHELKINNSSARLFGNVEEWKGVKTVVFRLLSARGLH